MPCDLDKKSAAETSDCSIGCGSSGWVFFLQCVGHFLQLCQTFPLIYTFSGFLVELVSFGMPILTDRPLDFIHIFTPAGLVHQLPILPIGNTVLVIK